MFDLNNGNFLLYAAKCYDRPHLVQQEFEDDLKRIKYLKRLFKKYRESGEFKERLILNHIIILANVFGVEAAVNILFFRLDIEDYPILKTLLIFLNYLPQEILITFNGKPIIQSVIPVDLYIAQILREI